MNVGVQTKELKPGERIASLQFVQMSDKADWQETDSENELLRRHSIDVNRFFLSGLGRDIDDLKASVATSAREIETLATSVRHVESSFGNLSSVGSYLLASAFLSIFGTVLVGVFGDQKIVPAFRELGHNLTEGVGNGTLVAWFVAGVLACTLLLGIFIKLVLGRPLWNRPVRGSARD